MCLAQRPPRSDTGEAEPAAPRSRVKHSTTESLPSLKYSVVGVMESLRIYNHKNEYFHYFDENIYIGAQTVYSY